jgi:hypothetical protein
MHVMACGTSEVGSWMIFQVGAKQHCCCCGSAAAGIISNEINATHGQCTKMQAHSVSANPNLGFGSMLICNSAAVAPNNPYHSIRIQYAVYLLLVCCIITILFIFIISMLYNNYNQSL